MGMEDELRRSFGDDFFTRKTRRSTDPVWYEICLCGHLDRFHGPTVGGTYQVGEPTVKTMGGEEWTVSLALDGCAGAAPHRYFEQRTPVIDREAHTNITRINPTCPCLEFHPIAKVDRPRRTFNQRMPADRNDRSRHPFVLATKAFRTSLGNRKQATADPSWATAEFDRRFEWLDGKRVCDISRCTNADDVWPVFVHEDRSELRCPQHR